MFNVFVSYSSKDLCKYYFSENNDIEKKLKCLFELTGEIDLVNDKIK